MKTKFLAYLTILIFSISLLACKNNSTQGPSFKLIPVDVDGKWGYVDGTGKMIIEPQYNFCDLFVDGIAEVISSSGKMGYIDETGKFIIKPGFKYATRFSEGLAFVTVEGCGITCIDKNGSIKFSLEDEIETANCFSDGLACVLANNKMGFIDKTGKYVINPSYDFATPFENGIASITQNEKTGYIDIHGKTIIEPQFKLAGTGFNNGLAWASVDGVTYGYIEKEGKFAISPIYDGAHPFSEGLAAVKKGNLWGYVDKSGKMVIDAQFDNAATFALGRAPVQMGNKWGFIDTKGKFIFDPKFDKLSKIYGSELAIAILDGKAGIVDKDGKYMANPMYRHSFVTEDTLNDELFYAKTITDKMNFEGLFKSIFFDSDGSRFRACKKYTTAKEIIDGFEGKYSKRGNVAFTVFGGRDGNNFSLDSIRYEFSTPVFFDSMYDPKAIIKDMICYISFRNAAAGKADVVLYEFKNKISRIYNANEQVPPGYRNLVAKSNESIKDTKTKIAFLFSNDLFFLLVAKEDNIAVLCDLE